MKIVSLAETKAKLSAYVDECARSPVVITRNGAAVAVLVAAPVDPDDLDTLVLANSPRFREMIRAAREEIDRGEVLSQDEFWERVEAMPEPEPEPKVAAPAQPAQPAPRRRRATNKRLNTRR